MRRWNDKDRCETSKRNEGSGFGVSKSGAEEWERDKGELDETSRLGRSPQTNGDRAYGVRMLNSELRLLLLYKWPYIM